MMNPRLKGKIEARHAKAALAGMRIVTKSGVRVNGSLYIVAGILPGERVLVRIDPADLGRIYCFSEDGLTYRGEGVIPETVASRRFHDTCATCQGNGEIVTDWDRYLSPQSGDKGDEAVAECPDCGSGL